MNRFFLITVSILICCFTIINGRVIETNSFKETTNHLTKDTIIILDIDDTLLIPVQMLGCDEWFKYQFAKHQQRGTSQTESLDKALAEWEAIRHITQMEIVEENTHKIIDSLQKEGYTIMGLTTQGLALATRTANQLKKEQIDLSLTAPIKEDCFFTIQSHGVLYRKGILFTAGTNKGAALMELCKQLKMNPKRIVFVNDKGTHLKEVEEVVEKNGIEFVGLRYAYSDSRKAKFNPAIADIQFHRSSFHHILSDEEAMQVLKAENILQIPNRL
ncbi:MAG: DUF2608 domain-containing protein [Chlamydiales bacterium]|nr:DUF2608 domain-containing protein [Chlamydiales bacterium]